MAEYKDCATHDSCSWLHDIGSCPENCNFYKNKDIVHVVRCKDCKNYGFEQEPCRVKIQRFCKLHKGLVLVDRETFCSYGERKE